MVTKELPKKPFDKSIINRWCSILYTIWSDDVDAIKRKLIIAAEDKLIWSDAIIPYIEEEVGKILN